MKQILLLVFVVLLIGCVDHPDVTNIDIETIERQAQSISQKSGFGILDESEIPEAIKQLNPKEVEVSNTGIYIVLSRGFGKESGLFWSPYFGGGAITSMGSDSSGFMPEFKHLSGNMFTYKRG